MPNVWKAIIRSSTTWLIGIIISVAVDLGYHVTLATATVIAGAVGFGLTLLAHLLEVKWPWFGVFLGWLGAPSYTPVVTKNQIIATLKADLAAALVAQSPSSVDPLTASSPAAPVPPAPAPLASPIVPSTSTAT